MRIGLTPEDLVASHRLAATWPTPVAARPRLYGIGTGKSGTNALASLFTGIPTAHEPEPEPVIHAVLDYAAGRSDWRSLQTLVLDRDRRLALSVDVANLNIFLVDLLQQVSPDSRFVLTIRDCYSWLDSLLNHYLRIPPTAAWRAFADWRFQKGQFSYPPAEQLLEEKGLYTLGGYLSYWTAHVSKAIAAVPADRLLIVRTDQIADRALEIAAFGGFGPAQIAADGIHEYRNPHKQRIVQEIPVAHLQEQVNTHCGSLMLRFFPEIRSPADAGLH